jgi:O18-antigen biosynthesis glycosyltransferase
MISILTPTYNRAYTLGRLYSSLEAQSVRDFEWIIVDDGSSDETFALSNEYRAVATFPVQYIRQKNAGKHVAINTGCISAKGSYVLIVDSDDALVIRAIETIENCISTWPREIGYCFRRKSFTGAHLGEELDLYSVCLTPNEAVRLFKADLAYVFSTKCIREHPFPVICGEKFVPELFEWNILADTGKVRYFPKEWIYLCEYLDDGLSKNFQRNLLQNPKGFALFYYDQIRRENNILGKVKNIIRLCQCRIYGVFHK